MDFVDKGSGTPKIRQVIAVGHCFRNLINLLNSLKAYQRSPASVRKAPNCRSLRGLLPHDAMLLRRLINTIIGEEFGF